MQYFLLEGEHLAPFETFRHLEPAHHAFLQKGYDDGFFLFSGPQIPPHGGFLVARARSRAARHSGVPGKADAAVSVHGRRESVSGRSAYGPFRNPCAPR